MDSVRPETCLLQSLCVYLLHIREHCDYHCLSTYVARAKAVDRYTSKQVPICTSGRYVNSQSPINDHKAPVISSLI